MFGSKPAGFGTAFGAGFGQQQAQNGTTIKFSPPQGQDTMVKNGVTATINTKHQCITAMKEYETKSLEELRVEDYTANRKGKQAGTTGFGFGTPVAATTQAGAGFAFGQNKTAFGASRFGTAGYQSTPTAGGLFGQQNTSPTGGTTGGLFGGGGSGTAFGAQSTGFSFGATPTAGTGLFGQKTMGSTSLFGTPAASSSNAFGFGTAGSNPGFGTTTSTSTYGGLFGTGSTPAAGGLFGTSTGFGQQQAQNGTIIKFSPPQGQEKMMIKGILTNITKHQCITAMKEYETKSLEELRVEDYTANRKGKQAGTTGFGFGTPVAATTQDGAGFAFGQNKTAFGASTGFGSGTSTGATNLFGQQQASQASTGLFGQSKPLFGTAATTQSGFGFGTSTSTGTGGLFGQQQANKPLFGTTTTQPSLFGTSGTTFGQPAASSEFTGFGASQAGGLFASKPPAFGTQDTASTGGFSFAQPANNQSNIFSAPATGFFNNATTSAGFGATQRTGEMEPAGGIGPSTTSTPAFNFGGGAGLSTSSNLLGNSTTLAKPGRFENITICTSVSGKGIPEHMSDTSNRGMLNARNQAPSPLQQEPMTSSQSQDDTVNISIISRDESNADDSIMDERPMTPPSPHPAGIVLTRPGYYTIPGLDVLGKMVDDGGDCYVEDLTIGREGYGSIFFPGFTNLSNMNLDEIVFFRSKEVIVYPDDDNKPPVGEGLNKKAEITLDCVWPRDKSIGTPIKSYEKLTAMRWQDKIEEISWKNGAEFIDYRSETGSWVFKVKHFSKYGLLDDSDEEDVSEQEKKHLRTAQAQQVAVQKQKLHMEQLEKQQLLKTKSGLNGHSNGQMAKFTIGTDDDESEGSLAARNEVPMGDDDNPMSDASPAQMREDVRDFDNDYDDMEMREEPPSSHRLATSMGVDARNMQVMKASFFSDEEAPISGLDDIGNLQQYLTELSHPDRSCTILDWHIGGKVYLDYINICQSMEQLSKAGEPSPYQLDRLLPEVKSLCTKVGSIPCRNSKDRLCQSEMAKRSANFLRLILTLQSEARGETQPPMRLLAPAHARRLCFT